MPITVGIIATGAIIAIGDWEFSPIEERPRANGQHLKDAQISIRKSGTPSGWWGPTKLAKRHDGAAALKSHSCDIDAQGRGCRT
jgi:hypothetical protein